MNNAVVNICVGISASSTGDWGSNNTYMIQLHESTMRKLELAKEWGMPF